MRVKAHTFGGRKFQIEEHGICGQVSEPDEPGKPSPRVLMVDHRLKGRSQMETWVHEAMHAALPRASEQTVTEAA